MREDLLVEFKVNPLKRWRLGLGYAVNEVAAMLEVTNQTIYNWEQGVCYPRTEKWGKLATLMDMRPGELRLAWLRWQLSDDGPHSSTAPLRLVHQLDESRRSLLADSL